MLTSPYLFKPETAKPNCFERMLTDHKNWYLWAQILENGTDLTYMNVGFAMEENIYYFIVDPCIDHHPCINPEEFINILAGSEENAMFWGYSWTIKEMATRWHNLIYKYYGKTNYSVNDYGMKIDYDLEKLEIVSKDIIWKNIEEINF